MTQNEWKYGTSPAAVLGSNRDLVRQGESQRTLPKNYSQALAFMPASFCCCMLAHALAQASSPASPPHPSILALQACVTMPGTSFLVFMLFKFFPKIVLFLNVQPKNKAVLESSTTKEAGKVHKEPRMTQSHHTFLLNKGPSCTAIGGGMARGLIACHLKETMLFGPPQI